MEVIPLINRSITTLHLLAKLHAVIDLYTNPSMPKIRDSGPKPDIYEVVTTHTRRGKRITHAAVKDSTPLPSSSRTSSPTKKRAWSPGVQQPDIDQGSFTDPTYKRSRTSGKVRMNRNMILLSSDNYCQTQNEFLREYLNRRHGILIELLRHESFPTRSSCSNCQQSTGMYRCRDCFGSGLWCSACCVSTHAHVPFHRIQMWNGTFFEMSDLLTHQLTIDLCHFPDDCHSIPLNSETHTIFDPESPDEADEFLDGHLPDGDQSAGTSGSTTHSGSRSKLTIVSSTGIFTRWIRWCHCAKSADQYVQLLLRAKLFPASFKNPKTAFTFEVLDHFRLDALECHTAAMNFMSKIGRITDEVFPSRVPVSGPMHRIPFPLIS